MKSLKQTVVLRMFTLFVFVFCAQIVQAAVIAPDLQQVMQDEGEVSVIVRFAERVELDKFKARGSSIRRSELIQALRDKAQATQRPAIELLRNVRAKRQIQLWAINALAVTVRTKVIQQLARLPAVERIELDATVQAPAPIEATASSTEWNLDAVRAPEFWSQGYTGLGTVVASMDTGVDAEHPDLAPGWRGGTNSWFDPNGEYASPYDRSGHGTQVMALAVGRDASGTAIGVAPGAQWIAVKIFNDAGVASLSVIHQGFQWLLDPDQDPNTNDMPDVVSNSWGFPELTNQCYMEFELDIETLKIAGVNVVFSAGNQGSASASTVSPANNPAGYAVGAVDSALNIAAGSSRGPSACGAALYPEVVAPGVNVKTADLTFGGLFPDSYVLVSGTSAAAPHVAGAIALLREAFINASVTDLEQVLEDSALDLGQPGADNDYGHGLVDVVAAGELLSSQP